MSLLLHTGQLRAIAIVPLLWVAFAMPNIANAQVGPDPGPPPPLPPSGPTVEPVSIASNNASSSSLAVPGDVVTLSFTVVGVVPLITPSVTIAGHNATVLSMGGNAWTASATMLADDAEGVITFSAVVGSADGSATTTAEAITSGPDVVFDKTAPIIASHAAVEAEATSSSGAVVSYTSPTADDGSAVSCLPASATTFALGTTTVACNASDAAGNAATSTSFLVTVADTTAPVITRTGAASLTLTVGDSFTDEGATTADIVDGAGTADVSGSVNTSSAGTYTLTYDKTDAAGNHAAAVTRTVTVNAAPSSSGGGGRGGVSIFPVAPVLDGVPLPVAVVQPDSTQAASAPDSPPQGIAPTESLVARTEPPAPERSGGETLAQAEPRPAPVLNLPEDETPPAPLPSIEPQESAEPQVAASGVLGISWWWLFLLLVLLALGGGYSAWRKYRKYREQHSP